MFNLPYAFWSNKSLLNGLIAYWTFEDNSNLGKDSLNIYNLATNGTVTQSTGNVSNGIAISNTASYIGSSSSSNFHINGDKTFCGWFKWSDNSHQNVLISKFAGASIDYLIFKVSLDNIRFRLDTNVTSYNLTSTTSVSINTWYFVACWVNFSTSKMYIQINNGTIDEVTYSGTPKTVNSFSIHDSATSTTNCNIDEVGVWSRILTTSELTSLYNSGNGKTYPFI